VTKVVLGLLLAGASALFAVSRTWASATVRTSGLPVDEISVSGASAAPILAGLAVVVIAAGLAVVAAGGWLRQLVGLLVAALGGYAALRALTLNVGGGPLGRALQDSPAYLAGARPPTHEAIWPWIAALSFAAVAVLGIVVAVRGRAWPRMSARYERTRATRAPDDDGTADDGDLWRALDAGEDPTR
jgi:uncharacterized membrane protein (TIGR02234 family)